MSTKELLNKQNDKTVFKIVLSISALICIVVVVLNQKLIPVPNSFPHFIYKLLTDFRTSTISSVSSVSTIRIESGSSILILLVDIHIPSKKGCSL